MSESLTKILIVKKRESYQTVPKIGPIPIFRTATDRNLNFLFYQDPFNPFVFRCGAVVH